MNYLVKYYLLLCSKVGAKLLNNQMKIIKTYNWNRRDFYYDAKCEHCGNVTTKNSGYDDDNYYNNVVPEKKCTSCTESTNSKSVEGVPTIKIIPKYSSDKHI